MVETKKKPDLKNVPPKKPGVGKPDGKNSEPVKTNAAKPATKSAAKSTTKPKK